MRDDLQLNEISKKLLELKNAEAKRLASEERAEENNSQEPKEQAVLEPTKPMMPENDKPKEPESKRSFFFGKKDRKEDKPTQSSANEIKQGVKSEVKRNEPVQIVHRDRGIAVSRYFENMQSALNEMNAKLDNFVTKSELGSIDDISFEKHYLTYLSDNIDRINTVDAINLLYNLSFRVEEFALPQFNEFNRLFERLYALSCDAESLLRLDERIKTKPRKRQYIKRMYEQRDETPIPLNEIINPPIIKERSGEASKQYSLYESMQNMFTTFISMYYDMQTNIFELSKILEDKIKDTRDIELRELKEIKDLNEKQQQAIEAINIEEVKEAGGEQANDEQVNVEQVKKATSPSRAKKSTTSKRASNSKKSADTKKKSTSTKKRVKKDEVKSDGYTDILEEISQLKTDLQNEIKTAFSIEENAESNESETKE